MRLGIRGQLLAPLAVALVGAVAVGAWAGWDAVRRERELLARRLDGIERTVEAAHFPLTLPVLEQMTRLTGADFDLLRPNQPTLCTHSQAVTVADIERFPASNVATLGGRDYFHRVQTLRPPHPSAGATLVILYPVDRWWESARAAALPVLGFATLAVLTAGLTLALGARVVGRVRAVEGQTRRIAAGDFAAMPLPNADDELRDLAQSVNTMADRLVRLRAGLRDAERWQLLGQVSGGLAHQLRNGVAGAKLALQLHGRTCPPDDSESLTVALRQLTIIESQLKRFLDLGNSEPRRPVLSDLRDIASDALDMIRPRAAHLGIALAIVGDDSSMAEVEPDQIGQLLANLLSNAIEACGPGGRVAVEVGSTGRHALICVADDGPGPSSAVAARLFEPFVTGKPEGIGLGLAYARRVADAHGGAIIWDRDDGWTRFRLTLPAAVAQEVPA